MKACVILNPTAGSVKDLGTVMGQLRRLPGAKIETTSRRGDALRFARKLVRNGCHYIIAAGGDGTLNEVINGVATHAREIHVGLVPLGTGNDFARALNLPFTIEENIDILLSPHSRAIDLVRVKSDRVRYFVNVSAGGFSGLVDEKLTPEMKRTWGPLAYVRSAAAAFPELHGYRTTIVFDDKERLSADVYNVIVANGRFVAGGLPVAPEADPSDGLLDIILISKSSKPEIVLLATQMLLGKHISNKAVVCRRAAKVSIRSRPGMWFNVDGELIGNEPSVFKVMPRAVQFVVGKK
jgi:diacylglycerol kinase (ATP)